MKRYKHAKRRPTSVDLEMRTIRRLKIIAKEQGIPSQVVMRIFITYDLEAMKKPRDVPWNQLMRTPLTQMSSERPTRRTISQTLKEHETNRRKRRAVKFHPVVPIFWG